MNIAIIALIREYGKKQVILMKKQFDKEEVYE